MVPVFRRGLGVGDGVGEGVEDGVGVEVGASEGVALAAGTTAVGDTTATGAGEASVSDLDFAKDGKRIPSVVRPAAASRSMIRRILEEALFSAGSTTGALRLYSSGRGGYSGDPFSGN